MTGKGEGKLTKSNHLRAWVVLFVAILLAGILAVTGARPAEAAFPGGNGKIAFNSNRDVGAGGIYTITPGGTADWITEESTTSSDPAYSPDGSRIAFRSANPGGDYQIFVMNADGTGRKQLTTSPTAKQEPTWSPDGTRIAYVANSFNVDGETDLEIWTMKAVPQSNTNKPVNLTDNSSGLNDTQPAWSPDGSKIAFTRSQDIWVMNSDGSGAANLTPNSPAGCSPTCYQGGDTYPAWSPDGSKIAYVHGYGPPTNPYAGGGLANIWVMDANPATTDWTNLSNTASESSTMPAWSPNGTKIAYVGTASDSTDRNIYTMDASGSISSRTPIDTDTAHDINPDWQPITLSVNDVKVKEKSTNAVFTVRLSSNSEETITVNYATADGSAKTPADYTATSGTLTFEPGQTAQQITVPIRGDRRDERNEKFFVNLSGATNATIFDAQGQATIVDND